MHLAHLMDHFAEKHLDNYHTFYCPKCSKKFGCAVSAHFHIRKECKVDGFVPMQNYSQALLSYDLSYSTKMYSLLKQSIFKYVTAVKAPRVKVETTSQETNTDPPPKVANISIQADLKPAMKSICVGTNVKTYNRRIQTKSETKKVNEIETQTYEVEKKTTECQTEAKLRKKDKKTTSSGTRVSSADHEQQTKPRPSLDSTNSVCAESLSIASSGAVPDNISEIDRYDLPELHQYHPDKDEEMADQKPAQISLNQSVAGEFDRRSIGLEMDSPRDIKTEPVEEHPLSQANFIPHTNDTANQTRGSETATRDINEPAETVAPTNKSPLVKNEETQENQNQETSETQNYPDAEKKPEPNRQNMQYGTYLDDFEESMAQEVSSAQKVLEDQPPPMSPDPEINEPPTSKNSPTDISDEDALSTMCMSDMEEVDCESADSQNGSQKSAKENPGKKKRKPLLKNPPATNNQLIPLMECLPFGELPNDLIRISSPVPSSACNINKKSVPSSSQELRRGFIAPPSPIHTSPQSSRKRTLSASRKRSHESSSSRGTSSGVSSQKRRSHNSEKRRKVHSDERPHLVKTIVNALDYERVIRHNHVCQYVNCCDPYSEDQCLFCRRAHETDDCCAFPTIRERHDLAKALSICARCGQLHPFRNCEGIKCTICKKTGVHVGHPAFLCYSIDHEERLYEKAKKNFGQWLEYIPELERLKDGRKYSEEEVALEVVKKIVDPG